MLYVILLVMAVFVIVDAIMIHKQLKQGAIPTKTKTKGRK